MRGLQKYIHNGATVLRLHRSVLPARDESTPEGRLWVERSSAKYPGGITSTDWRRDQENDWSVRGRHAVFPTFKMRYKPYVVTKNTLVKPHWTGRMGYDYGVRVPFCALFAFWETPSGPIRVVDEVYRKGTPAGPPQAKLIMERIYWPRVWRSVYGDPSIWREDQTIVARDGVPQATRMTSIGKMLRDAGVTIRPGNNSPGSDVALRDLLVGYFWRDPKKPLLTIDDCCVNLIEEIEALHFKDYVSKMTRQSRDLQETIASRKNHAWDALKYLIFSGPIPMRIANEDPDELSVRAVRKEIAARRARLRRALYG